MNDYSTTVQRCDLLGLVTRKLRGQNKEKLLRNSLGRAIWKYFTYSPVNKVYTAIGLFTISLNVRHNNLQAKIWPRYNSDTPLPISFKPADPVVILKERKNSNFPCSKWFRYRYTLNKRKTVNARGQELRRGGNARLLKSPQGNLLSTTAL